MRMQGGYFVGEGAFQVTTHLGEVVLHEIPSTEFYVNIQDVPESDKSALVLWKIRGNCVCIEDEPRYIAALVGLINLGCGLEKKVYDSVSAGVHDVGEIIASNRIVIEAAIANSKVGASHIPKEALSYLETLATHPRYNLS